MPDTLSVHDRLVRLIAATGPISIADYMGSANAQYYATRDPLGADGDFTTAPEISQMFGEIVGLTLADTWHRAGRGDAVYVELGPGRGTLARDILRVLARIRLYPPVHLVETSPALRAKQGALLPRSIHHMSINSLPTDRPLLIVANEFFDALPIRQIVRTEAGWRESMVALDGGRLVPAAGSTPMDEQVPLAVRDAPVGSIYEICPAASAIAADLGARLAVQGGVMLSIDYGYSGPKLGDTLQAVCAHAFADPFANAGEADLTAHVDFTSLAAAAHAAGAAVSQLATQGDWLIVHGIDERCLGLIAHNSDRAAELQSQRDRLVKAEAMGQMFKVIAFHAPHWPCPAGLEL